MPAKQSRQARSISSALSALWARSRRNALEKNSVRPSRRSASYNSASTSPSQVRWDGPLVPSPHLGRLVAKLDDVRMPHFRAH